MRDLVREEWKLATEDDSSILESLSQLMVKYGELLSIFPAVESKHMVSAYPALPIVEITDALNAAVAAENDAAIRCRLRMW